MAAPILLVENLWSVRLYPAHTVTANEEASGTEAFRIADGRRSSRDFWSPTTLNNDAWNKVRCDRVRATDVVVLDRGHNLAGEVLRYQQSDDDFTSTQTIVDVTLPSASAPGSVDDALGVRTREGAWIKRYSVRGAADHRLFLPAMGAGLKPQVVGWWAGLSWSPGAARLPFAPNVTELVVEERESTLGWIGRGKATPRRNGVLHFKFTTLFDYELAQLHIEGMYAQGTPMWIVPDSDQADRAFLAILQKGMVGGEHPSPDWMYPRLDVPYVEHEPKEL